MRMRARRRSTPRILLTQRQRTHGLVVFARVVIWRRGNQIVQAPVGNTVAHFLEHQRLQVKQLGCRRAGIPGVGIDVALATERGLQQVHFRRGEELIHGGKFGIAQCFHGRREMPEAVPTQPGLGKLAQTVQAAPVLRGGLEGRKQLVCLQFSRGHQRLQDIAGRSRQTLVSSGNFCGSTKALEGNGVALDGIQSNGRGCAQLNLVFAKYSGFLRNAALCQLRLQHGIGLNAGRRHE